MNNQTESVLGSALVMANLKREPKAPTTKRWVAVENYETCEHIGKVLTTIGQSSRIEVLVDGIWAIGQVDEVDAAELKQLPKLRMSRLPVANCGVIITDDNADDRGTIITASSFASLAKKLAKLARKRNGLEVSILIDKAEVYDATTMLKFDKEQLLDFDASGSAEPIECTIATLLAA